MHPNDLERYAFWWSEARLLIAAVALFLGGIPPIWYFIRIPALFGIIQPALTLCWMVSGVASVYLLIGWWGNKQMLFGNSDRKDRVAFFVMIISGLNLGAAGLIGKNIGMSISSNYSIFLLVGALYVVSAIYLYSRWSSHGNKMF